MKFKLITTLAAFSLIGGGGFMVGRWSSGSAVAARNDGAGVKTATRTMSVASSQDLLAGGGKVSRAHGSLKNQDSLQGRLNKLATMIRGENPLERNRALLAFLGQLSPADFGAAVAQFKSLGITDDRTAEYGMLLSAWTQADPLAAMAYAKENADDDFVQNTILTTWATNDPEAAIRWAKSEFKGEGANPYLAGIIRGIAQTDLTRAAGLLTGMPRSVERGEALDFMLPHYIAQGADATRSWIASLTDDSLQNGAMERAAESLAEIDPAATAAWLIAHPGEAAQRRMDDVYSIWAGKDEQAALSSFGSLPVGEIRTNALRGIITSMAPGNAKAAIALMDRYSTDVTDRLVQSFIWHSARSDPAAAASQIERIGNERQRDQMYGRLLGNWLDHDPAAAKTWMAKNVVPDAVRERLEGRQ
jgi:hypothetical protein